LRQIIEVCPGPFVLSLQGAIFEILEYLGPNGLGFSYDDRIAIPHRFFWQHGGMDAADNGGNAPLPINFRDLIGTIHSSSTGRNAYNVSVSVLERLNVLVEDINLIVIRSHGS
jgi:hypothetical protein